MAAPPSDSRQVLCWPCRGGKEWPPPPSSSHARASLLPPRPGEGGFQHARSLTAAGRANSTTHIYLNYTWPHRHPSGKLSPTAGQSRALWKPAAPQASFFHRRHTALVTESAGVNTQTTLGKLFIYIGEKLCEEGVAELKSSGKLSPTVGIYFQPRKAIFLLCPHSLVSAPSGKPPATPAHPLPANGSQKAAPGSPFNKIKHDFTKLKI